MFDNILGGLHLLMAPMPLVYCVLGTAVGVFVGAIPGLSGAMLVALFLPVTFYMEPLNALVFIIGVYVGAVAGGLVAAILLKIPGTISAIMTTLDGYPMAQQGHAARALAMGITASLVGGVFSWFVLISLAEPISRLATRFSPFDYFALVMLAFVMIASLSERSLAKALLSAALGFLIALPGVDPSSAEARITFDIVALNAGFPMLPFFVGMFAVGTVLGHMVETSGQQQAPIAVDLARRAMPRMREWRGQLSNLFRSSGIGVGVGILPGIGSNVASIAAYVGAKSFSRTPEKFGEGSEEGLVAAESSNNAAVGGALVPTLALGVPGSFVDVLLLAAFLIHNLHPGPRLFASQGDLAYALIIGYLLANVFMFIIMMASIRMLTRALQFPTSYLFPIIMVFSVLGAYALDNTTWALVVMLIFGLLGFVMERLDFPLAPFAVAYVLGPLAEQRLRTGLQMTGGDYSPLYTNPLTAGLLAAAILALGVSLYLNWRRWRRRVADDRS